MFKTGTVVCEMEMLFVKTTRGTGKEYKKWEWIGWTTYPAALESEGVIKGKWLHVEENGRKVRYNLETKHEVTN